MVSPAMLIDSRQNVMHLPSFSTSQAEVEQISSQSCRSSKNSRKRGVILTQQGWQKLMQAEVLYDDFGSRYTYEQLSERSLLDARTVSRILSCEVKVDKRTLKTFFRAFNLQLDPEDYTTPDQPSHEMSEIHAASHSPFAHAAAFNAPIDEIMRLKQQIVESYAQLFNLLGIYSMSDGSALVHQPYPGSK